MAIHEGGRVEDSAEKSWYVIHCKPRNEFLARDNLERQGYTTYLPVTSQPRRRNHQRIYITEPLFPRYLFIHLNQSTDNWSPIRSTLGVSKLVSFGYVPAKMPEEMIGLLQARENTDGLHDTNTEFSSGEKIRIEDGPMTGYEGVFLARTSKERVIVLLDILGREARIKVNPDLLSKAG